MNFATVQDWWRANPFQPFRVVMTDGRAFDVMHRDMLWPGTQTLLIGIQDPTQPPGVFGQYISAALPYIVRIEPIGTAVVP